MDELKLYKNKYLQQQEKQQQFQSNQKNQQQQQQQQNNNNNNNFINLDGTSLQLASKLRQIKEKLEKSCANLNQHQQQQQQRLNNLKAVAPPNQFLTPTGSITAPSPFRPKSDFFDYQKSQFNFDDEHFSDCVSQASEDANSTLISDSNKMSNVRQQQQQLQQQQLKSNDSFTSSTLSSVLMSKPNKNGVFVTPPDSLILTPDNATNLRKRYQIEKQYSIYSEDSLYKTQNQPQQQNKNDEISLSSNTTVINNNNVKNNQPLQEATYSDNISRQSSIRSLISLDKKITEMAARKQMIQQKFLAQPTKFHPSLLNNNNLETNSNSSQFDDNERLLLLNWENYDAMSQSSASTLTTSNHEPRKRMQNKFTNGAPNGHMKPQQINEKKIVNLLNNDNRRPETRMGFRAGENDDDDDDMSINNHRNSNNMIESNFDTESQIESSLAESIIIDNTKSKINNYPLPMSKPAAVATSIPTPTIPINQNLPSNDPLLQSVQLRTATAKARLFNNRDSERRKTTSDLMTNSESNKYNNRTYEVPQQQSDQQRYNQRTNSIQQQQFNTNLLSRNAVSDLNVANFDINLNEIKYKQNNFFNGLHADNVNEQDKYKRYQALSASINKIFTDLFENFEKSKQNGNENENGLLQMKQHHQQQLLNDSHSNKDSGFIQEYNNSTISPQQSKPSSSNASQQLQQQQQQQQQQQLLQQQQQQAQNSLKSSNQGKSATVSNNTGAANTNTNTSKDISLLERYLNSEQQISFKYRQIINILERAYSENGYLIEDYSLAEYILNQEGISYQTFQQSIREKYCEIEWTDYLLQQLYHAINSDSFHQHPHGDLRYVNTNGNNDYTNSPSSSQASKSFRKVRDIKQASQQKRNSKLIQQQYQNSDDYVFEDSLNESFNNRHQHAQQHSQTQQHPSNDNQNTSIVESCGILMKTNSWRKEIEDYFEVNSINKQQDLKRARKGSLPEAKLNYMLITTNGNKVNSTSSNHTANNHNSSLNRANNSHSKDDEFGDGSSYHTQKHQNAFILEILRTSMFRSKSATDLRNLSTRSSNKSLNKIDVEQQNNNNPNNTSYDSGGDNETDDRLCNFYRHSQSCTKCLISSLSNEQIDSHRGLIWQCADMCYTEFTNKYEELLWLLDGGNYSIQSKLKEVEQRLSIDTKLYSNNQTFYNSLVQDNKIGSSNSTAVQQRLLKQLNTLKEKINELKSLRLYLLMCQANIKAIDMNNLEILFNVNNTQKSSTAMKTERILQGKSVSNILISLYGPDAIRTGFVYQLYIVYRYFYSSLQLFEFFSETFRSCLKLKDKDVKETMLARTLDLIKMWVDGFYVIDFQQNDQLYKTFELFAEKEICEYNKTEGQIILTLLHKPGLEFNTFASNSAKYNIKVKDVMFGKQNGNTIVNKLRTPLLKDNTSMSNTSTPTSSAFNSSNLNETTLYDSNDPDCAGRSSKTMNLCMSKRFSAQDLTYLPKMSRKIDSFSLDDYPIFIIASQLTLIEWDNFLDIHPCHCLNSKAQGIFTDAKAPISAKNIFTQQSLFVDNYLSKSIYKMIQFNYSLTHWVSAEILSANNLKSQVSMISKFLAVAKLCCEWSNFSTAFCIYDGLQELIIKQLPAWKHVSNKTIHVLDRIASFKLLLQNEPLLLRRLCQSTNQPAIPCMHLFLVLVQQHELGSFQLVNGLWKWSKLSFLANLVDQIRIIQQHYVYNFQKHEDVADTLMQRIDSFKDIDLLLLAENNNDNFYHPKLNTPNIVAAASNLSKKSSMTSIGSAIKYQSSTPEHLMPTVTKKAQQAYKRENFK